MGSRVRKDEQGARARTRVHEHPRLLATGPHHHDGFGLHTYAEAIDYIRDSSELSSAEKTAILGESLRHQLRWPPKDLGHRLTP